MKYIKSRAQAAPICYFTADNKPEHVVEPNAAGYFEVTSNKSGNVYRVDTDGSCSCPGFRHSGRCRHLDAVLYFAARVLEEQREAAARAQNGR